MKRIKLTLTFGKCVNIELGLLLQYAEKRAMCTNHTKSLNDVMRNKNFGGTHINEIPSKGSSLSTRPSSHSNLIDDVYIPVVTNPCYNVEPTLDNGF